MSKKIIELGDKLKSKIYSDYNAGKHTWFRTGGNAKIFAIVEDDLELTNARLSLVKAVALTIRKGLSILKIKPIYEM